MNLNKIILKGLPCPMPIFVGMGGEVRGGGEGGGVSTRTS